MGCAALMAAHSPSSIRVDGSARLAATCVRSQRGPSRTSLSWAYGGQMALTIYGVVALSFMMTMYASSGEGPSSSSPSPWAARSRARTASCRAHGPSGGRGLWTIIALRRYWGATHEAALP